MYNFSQVRNWTGLDLVRKLTVNLFSYKIILYELEKVLVQQFRHVRRGFLPCTVRKHVFVQGFVQRKEGPYFAVLFYPINIPFDTAHLVP